MNEPSLRRQIRKLQDLGPLPQEGSSRATQELLDQYNQLIESIPKPVSDQEALALVKLFGGDDTCYGLSWGLLHLIESAPGWPLTDGLTNLENGWIRFLRDRATRGGRLPIYLGYVSTEGGPLLIADRDQVGAWRGVESSDYSAACEALEKTGAPGVEITINGQRAVAWNMPTGTADIWRSSPELITICRPWLDDAESQDKQQQRPLATLPPARETKIGELTLDSGWLAVLWAADAGNVLAKVQPTDGLAFDLSVGHSAIVVALPPGEYVLLHDEVREHQTSAIRCHIRPGRLAG